MNIRFKVAVVTVVFFLVSVVLSSAMGNSATGVSDSTEGDAPFFHGVTLEGEPISLSDLLKAKKVIIVNFWGIRCSACLEEMPHLSRIQQELSDQGVVVLGINVDGADGALLRELMTEKPLHPGYTIIPDPDFSIAEVFKLTGAPLTVMIDNKGSVRYRHENFSPGDEMEFRSIVLQLIGEVKEKESNGR